MNTFYNNYRTQVEVKKSNEEKRERSFGEQMFPVVIAGKISKGIIHILSFCGGVIMPAYGFDLLFGSFYIGLFLGFVMVFVFIELPKWAIVNTISENYFDSGIVSYGLSLLALVFIIPSIINSTYGVEIAVFWCAPDAELVSVEDIEGKYAKLSDKALAHWEPQISKHSTEKVNYFNTYKKYYTSEGKSRLPSNKQRNWERMDSEEKKATNSLNSRLDTIQSQLQNAISLAATTNNARTTSHNFRKENAGTIAFWVMMLLECGYVLIVFGLGYVSYRSEQERIGIEPKETESNNIIRIQTDSNKNEQAQQVEKQAVARNPIKFGNEQHGQLFTPQGAKKQRVRYMKEDGNMTEYTQSDLVRMVNRPVGSDEYKTELKRLINLFETE